MKKLKTIALILFLAVLPTLQAQELRRRGFWGADLRHCSENYGVCIDNVVKDGPADKATLKNGDVIIKINSESVLDYINFSKINRALRANELVDMQVYRSGKTFGLKITLAKVPRDSFEGVDFEYGELKSKQGYTLRTVLSKPKGVEKKLPAILFIKWLACSPVEGRGSEHGYTKVLSEISKAGYIVYRVETPGTGDSEGIDCSDLDFYNELSVFESALDKLGQIEQVDQGNVFIYGTNSGGVLAPMIASNSKNVQVRGIAVSGTWIRTWFEHIIDQERRIMNYLNTDASEINKKMNLSGEFHSEYLIEQKDPKSILREKPYLKEVWHSNSFTHHFGDRSIEYFQQMNHADIAGSWDKVGAYTLVVYNEYDWMISEEDHQILYEMVSKSNPGKAKFVKVPNTDHGHYLYENVTKAESFSMSSVAINPESSRVVIEWLESVKN